MPEISRFFGIVVKMYWDEHNPPHFHVYSFIFKLHDSNLAPYLLG